MAIVPMLKMRLVGLKYEREKILNAIQTTQLVEIIDGEEVKDTVRAPKNEQLKDLNDKFVRVNKSIEFIEECALDFYGKKSEQTNFESIFNATYKEFTQIYKKEEQLLKHLAPKHSNEQDKSIFDNFLHE